MPFLHKSQIIISVLSTNSISTAYLFSQFQINQLPLILGYLALDESIAYACNALNAKYSLVQWELYRHSVLASQFNYEGSAEVATSYKYSCYANIHAGVEIVAARRERNIVVHIGIQSNVIDNNKMQSYNLLAISAM